MSSKAIAEKDWPRDLVRIAVRRDHSGDVSEALVWGDTSVRVLSQNERAASPADDMWLDIREDDARAIYEALADHFGHNGHDTRALRRDYDAERGRVDKLIAHLTGGPR